MNSETEILAEASKEENLTMKKLLSLILCLLLCFLLFACNTEKKDSASSTEAKQNEGTNNTKQTQPLDNKNEDSAENNGNNEDNTTINGKYFEPKIENGKFVFPDSDILYVLVYKRYNELKFNNSSTIEAIVNLLKSMKLYKVDSGGSLATDHQRVDIHFSNNSYTRFFFDDDGFIIVISGEYPNDNKVFYVAEDKTLMENFMDLVGWVNIGSGYTVTETEMTNGILVFSNPIERINLGKNYYESNKNYSVGCDEMIYYKKSQSLQNFLDVICSFEFSKTTPTEDIPTHRPALYLKFFSDAMVYTEIKIIDLNSEIFFYINDEFYTVSDEDLELFKSIIPFAL